MKYAIYWRDGVGIGTPTDVFIFYSEWERQYYIKNLGDAFPDHRQHFQAVTKAEAEAAVGRKAVANRRAEFIANDERMIKKIVGA